MTVTKSNAGLMSEIIVTVADNFNHKPTSVTRHGSQMCSGILRTVQPTSFDTRARRTLWQVAGIGLPTAATPAQNPEAQRGNERKGHATVSM
jgi:hypothetical protein